MAQSLASIIVHLIFSTKDRQQLILPSIRVSLFRYMATIAEQQESVVYEIGGIEDHVHLLLSLSRTMPLAKLVELIKKESSKWLKQKAEILKSFAWQNGYGAFSVSASNIQMVRRYIREQEIHHQRRDFKDELRLFLRNSGLSFDEKHLWT